MSELVDRAITGLAALGGSAAFLEILRRWLQRRQEKRQEQLQLDPAGPRRRTRNAATRPSFWLWKPRCRRSWRPPDQGQRSPHSAPGRRHFSRPGKVTV